MNGLVYTTMWVEFSDIANVCRDIGSGANSDLDRMAACATASCDPRSKGWLQSFRTHLQSRDILEEHTRSRSNPFAHGTTGLHRMSIDVVGLQAEA